jgi:hypothetical protein
MRPRWPNAQLPVNSPLLLMTRPCPTRVTEGLAIKPQLLHKTIMISKGRVQFTNKMEFDIDILNPLMYIKYKSLRSCIFKSKGFLI